VRIRGEKPAEVALGAVGPHHPAGMNLRTKLGAGKPEAWAVARREDTLREEGLADGLRFLVDGGLGSPTNSGICARTTRESRLG
jgi:hypothetical protein